MTMPMPLLESLLESLDALWEDPIARIQVVKLLENRAAVLGFAVYLGSFEAVYGREAGLERALAALVLVLRELQDAVEKLHAAGGEV